MHFCWEGANCIWQWPGFTTEISLWKTLGKMILSAGSWFIDIFPFGSQVFCLVLEMIFQLWSTVKTQTINQSTGAANIFALSTWSNLSDFSYQSQTFVFGSWESFLEVGNLFGSWESFLEVGNLFGRKQNLRATKQQQVCFSSEVAKGGLWSDLWPIAKGFPLKHLASSKEVFSSPFTHTHTQKRDLYSIEGLKFVIWLQHVIIWFIGKLIVPRIDCHSVFYEQWSNQPNCSTNKTTQLVDSCIVCKCIYSRDYTTLRSRHDSSPLWESIWIWGNIIYCNHVCKIMQPCSSK